MVKLSRIVFIALLSLSFSTCSLFAPQTVWIDVRTPEEYQQDHIADTLIYPRPATIEANNADSTDPGGYIGGM